MEDPFEVFYDYLKKSQNIREFCEGNEQLLLDTVRTERFTDSEKIHFLNILGSQIDNLVTNIDNMKKYKKKNNVPTIPKDKPKKLTKEELKFFKPI